MQWISYIEKGQWIIMNQPWAKLYTHRSKLTIVEQATSNSILISKYVQLSCLGYDS